MSHQKFKECIDACLACAIECEHCATACLGEQNVNMMTTCIQRDRDCADICILTARLLARGSRHGEHLLRECAEICDLCADECSKHQIDHCQRCAEACRNCAEECRRMSTEMV
jgi:hypothetical protein